MRIATWNVNSIKVRTENVLDWLRQTEPDVACLQELKTVDEGFPREVFEEAGYNVAVHGQKSFNGVAILSKLPFDETRPRLPGDDADEQARYIEATISVDDGVLHVASIYLPNGNPTDSPKYPYKLGLDGPPRPSCARPPGIGRAVRSGRRLQRDPGGGRRSRPGRVEGPMRCACRRPGKSSGSCSIWG